MRIFFYLFIVFSKHKTSKSVQSIKSYDQKTENFVLPKNSKFIKFSMCYWMMIQKLSHIFSKEYWHFVLQLRLLNRLNFKFTKYHFMCFDFFMFTAKQAVTFFGEQYVTWESTPETSMNSLVTDIFVRFKSNQASGIILFITGQSASEFMLLELFERTLVLKIKINGMFSFILFNFSYLSVVWISGERL